MSTLLIVKHLGLCDYRPIWQRMQVFTDTRAAETNDELWLLQHRPVFTQGQAGKPEHILNPGNIPIIQTDRGGQVTYHGPGQLVAYTLFDMQRLRLGTRDLVRKLEQTVIQVLQNYDIIAENRCEAPGVYVNDAKICSIGLRIRKGYSYHGIAFNIAMDLEPFHRINPCGFDNLAITQLSDWLKAIALEEVENKFVTCLQANFGYNELLYFDEREH